MHASRTIGTIVKHNGHIKDNLHRVNERVYRIKSILQPHLSARKPGRIAAASVLVGSSLSLSLSLSCISVLIHNSFLTWKEWLRHTFLAADGSRSIFYWWIRVHLQAPTLASSDIYVSLIPPACSCFHFSKFWTKYCMVLALNRFCGIMMNFFQVFLV